MKILQVLGMSAGGIARHVAQLTSALEVESGFDVTVAGPPNLPMEIPGGVTPVTVPAGMIGHRKAVKALAALIDGRDVVHAHGLRAGIDSALAARSSGVPVVTTVHNLVQREISGAMRARLFGYGEPLVARASNRVIAVSEDIAAHLRARAPHYSDKIEVIHLGIGRAPEVRRSRAAVRASLGVDESTDLIVTASRLSAQKAVHVLIDAVALIPSALLVVLGEGPLLEELQGWARDAGAAGRVRFLGFVSDPADHIAAADVFALSSIWEGVPLAAQEAISLGVPVVATAVGGTPELIADGVTGRLVPPRDASAMARALNETLTNPRAASEMAIRAREHLEKEFSTSRMLERVISIYEELTRA